MSNIGLIVLALIQHGPEMARAIITLFEKESPSQADWEALFATYRKPYESYTSGPPTLIIPPVPPPTGGLPPIP